MFEISAAIYLTGVVIGLVVMRDRWTVRLLTAALWPLGFVAFAAVVAILLVAAVYLWPIPMLVTVAAAIGLLLVF
jgi:hypothetical protein